MKYTITFLLLIGSIIPAFGQNQNKRDYSYYNSLNIGIGYIYSFNDSDDKGFHLLDLGVNKTKYGGRHGGGYQYGIGTEIGLNTEKLTIGPKISGTFYYQFIVLGTELITYTDFDNFTLRLAPFIGIGGEKFRLTISPQAILTNKKFRPVNKGLINLTVNLSLNREKNKSIKLPISGQSEF